MSRYKRRPVKHSNGVLYLSDLRRKFGVPDNVTLYKHVLTPSVLAAAGLSRHELHYRHALTALESERLRRVLKIPDG